ncbi:MAG: hypothetical protein ACREKL_02490 [Chthoniobacterales bacterium]
MWKPFLTVLALALLAPVTAHAAAQVFSGRTASLDFDGEKLDGSFILRARGAHLSGWIYADGISSRMSVSGSVNPDGRFRAHIAGPDGIAGSISGKVDHRLTARGSLRIPGAGSDGFTLASHIAQKAPPGFEGTFNAAAPVKAGVRPQKIQKVIIAAQKKASTGASDRYSCTITFVGMPSPNTFTSEGFVSRDRLIISSNSTNTSTLSYYFEIQRVDIASTSIFDIKGSYNVTSPSNMDFGTFEGYETR